MRLITRQHKHSNNNESEVIIQNHLNKKALRREWSVENNNLVTRKHDTEIRSTSTRQLQTTKRSFFSLRAKAFLLCTTYSANSFNMRNTRNANESTVTFAWSAWRCFATFVSSYEGCRLERNGK